MALKENAKIMPHQQRAMDKAMDNDGSILISHSMGLGKTFTSVAIANKLREKGKASTTLAVVPASLRTNFADNGVHKYTKDKATILGTVSEGGHHIDNRNLPRTPYYVVSYDMFKKDPDKYIDRLKADTIIVDEMHNFRNPDTKNYQQMMGVRGRVKNFIGLTGTPFNNHPHDIVPLLDIVSNKTHGLPNDKGKFSRKFMQKGPQYDMRGRVLNKFHEGEKLVNTHILEKELGKWVHHATNDDIKGDGVPDKMIEDIDVEMSPLQVQHYNFAMQKVPKSVRETIRQGLPVDRKEAFHILPALMQARNVSNGVHYFNKNISLENSALWTPKINRAVGDIHKHLNETPDGQVIVHSHMLEGGVDVMEAGLRAKGIPTATFTGRMKDTDRQAAVKAYNAGKIKALVISSAGATGLNLPNTTMHVALDGHYNPAVISQIEARGIRAGGQAHREKKDRKVMVRRYRSVFPENWMTKLKLRKKDIAVDEWIYGIANDKQDVNSQAEEILKKTASELEDLRKDLAGEHAAISLYQKHIDRIKDREVVSKLKHIQGEEKMHVKELKELLDKRAKEDPDNTLNYATDGLAVAAGGNVMHKFRHELAGVQQVYHGTSKENANSIWNEGLKAERGGTGGASDAVGSQFYKKRSAGYVHVTPDENLANNFSRISENKGRMMGPGGTTFKINIPYEDYAAFEKDPDCNNAYKTKSDIGTNHFKGHKDYSRKGTYFKNYGRYIENHTERFRRGLGGTLIGAGIAGLGVYDAYTRSTE